MANYNQSLAELLQVYHSNRESMRPNSQHLLRRIKTNRSWGWKVICFNCVFIVERLTRTSQTFSISDIIQTCPQDRFNEDFIIPLYIYRIHSLFFLYLSCTCCIAVPWAFFDRYRCIKNIHYYYLTVSIWHESHETVHTRVSHLSDITGTSPYSLNGSCHKVFVWACHIGLKKKGVGGESTLENLRNPRLLPENKN